MRLTILSTMADFVNNNSPVIIIIMLKTKIKKWLAPWLIFITLCVGLEIFTGTIVSAGQEAITPVVLDSAATQATPRVLGASIDLRGQPAPAAQPPTAIGTPD